MNIEDAPQASDFNRREAVTDGPRKAYATSPDIWYVVQYKAGLNGRTLDMTMATLRAEGFEAYRPMFIRNKRQRIGGVRSTVIRPAFEPLFPPYMFIRRLQPGRMAITSIYGLEASFLGAVTSEAIEKLRGLEQDGYIHFVSVNDTARRCIDRGDTVETLDGFMSAVVTKVLPGERLELLSRFMGGNSRVVVSLAQVVRTARADGDHKPRTGGEMHNPFIEAERYDPGAKRSSKSAKAGKR